MDLRVTTWNVNSIRRRLDHLAWLVEAEGPDVLCLQETKVTDPLFPIEALNGLGYPHVAHRGIKAYNGVAIASRVPLRDVEALAWVGREDARHLSARLLVDGAPGPIELHDLYVPAGGEKPDPLVNPKFAHKLDFLTELACWWTARTQAAGLPMILVGDLNVAPLETDVWSHERLRNVVTHTPVEIAHLRAFQRSADWVDAVRHFIPEDRHVYSWWSYRNSDWETADKGRRLDHVWVTPPLVPHLKAVSILEEARGWEQPTDHVPVSVTLSF